jgi:hypothetical protein
VRRWLARLDNLALAAVLAGGVWWGAGQLHSQSPPSVAAPKPSGPAQISPAPAPPGTVRDSAALRALEQLAVKGRAPKIGYTRDQFGRGWVDVDHNGCDTRNDMLRRDLTSVVLRPSTHECVVEQGRLADPYTGRTIDFVKGDKTSTLVQIDHVVALLDAWQKGAQAWDVDKRVQFANDPLNLLAVDGAANQQKGAGDAATWLPKNKAFRCTYVARQIEVKAKYAVWVTAAEKDAMKRVLEACAR